MAPVTEQKPLCEYFGLGLPKLVNDVVVVVKLIPFDANTTLKVRCCLQSPHEGRRYNFDILAIFEEPILVFI